MKINNPLFLERTQINKEEWLEKYKNHNDRMKRLLRNQNNQKPPMKINLLLLNLYKDFFKFKIMKNP